jgi:hypothetical protein
MPIPGGASLGITAADEAVVVAVAAPLPDVPMHVVQTPRIGGLQSHEMGIPLPGAGCSGIEPGILSEDAGIAMERAARAGATAVLPLGFCRQLELPVRRETPRRLLTCRQLAAELAGLVPVHVHGGKELALLH